MKNVLVKVLDENLDQWLYLWGVLFTQRVTRYSFTRYPPFYLMYSREPLLPVNLKYGLNSEPVDLSEPFDQDMFEAVLSIANGMSVEIHDGAGRNIK